MATTTPPPSPPIAAGTGSDPFEKETGIREEIALCLSGGGYRAMIFHLGALIRLNETGTLKKLGRVSSVSGGSITAAMLGLKWNKLAFNANGVAINLETEVIAPIVALGGETIDAGSVIAGILNPFDSISDHITKAYRKHLFGDATLQDLPLDSEGPRFVINATNVMTGALWRFSRPFMGDWKVGITPKPTTSLAQAVTASSAFPPILSPMELDLSGCEFPPLQKPAPLQRKPFTQKAVLSDGGVYDNMGLETAWKHSRTLLVSDAGAAFKPEEKPHSDWTRHSIRVLDLIDNQVRSLRKIALINALDEKDPARKEHDGAYWSINSDLTRYPTTGELPCAPDRAHELAATPTRLAELDAGYMNRLINWGYAISTAALLSHYPTSGAPAAKFPRPGGV
ncbi:patatin-like phospholipase family protein [Prosthecobacter sp.]|uniref:patatin-like phospholipase family protein n=1 Tax=Prosthecobacter sp. TaxID=1965333 RepID=UPI003783C495